MDLSEQKVSPAKGGRVTFTITAFSLLTAGLLLDELLRLSSSTTTLNPQFKSATQPHTSFPQLDSASSNPTLRLGLMQKRIMTLRRKLLVKKQKGSPYPIDDLCDDVLDLIIEQLCLTDVKACFMLARTSKRLYIATTRRLYRHIIIDFSREIELALLRRLKAPGSNLPKLVRTLYVKDHQKATPQGANDLLRFFSSLTNLEKMTWRGALAIPKEYLDILHEKYPRAKLCVDADISVTTPQRPVLRNVFNHNVTTQLTSFEFYPTEIEQFYPQFKSDLIYMMVKCPQLAKLVIDPRNGVGPLVEFSSDMSMVFRKHSMPTLEYLLLGVTLDPLFTEEELELWGEQGGWSRLHTLDLISAGTLAPFTGHIPVLKTLRLLIGSRNLDDLEAHLDSLTADLPLGIIQTLKFSRPLVFENVSILIPWCILKRIRTTVTTLEIEHDYTPSEGINVNSPPATEIQALRIMCPNLQIISMDVIAPDGETWPAGFLEELSLFEHLSALRLYIHNRAGPLPLTKAKSFRNSITFRLAYRRMLKTRTESNLRTDTKFAVLFKTVQPQDLMAGHWSKADYALFRQNGKTKTKRRKPVLPVLNTAGMSAEELEEKRKKLARKIMVRMGTVWTAAAKRDYKHYIAVKNQQERNRYNEKAGKAFGDEVTLLNTWT